MTALTDVAPTSRQDDPFLAGLLAGGGEDDDDVFDDTGDLFDDAGDEGPPGDDDGGTTVTGTVTAHAATDDRPWTTLSRQEQSALLVVQAKKLISVYVKEGQCSRPLDMPDGFDEREREELHAHVKAEGLGLLRSVSKGKGRERHLSVFFTAAVDAEVEPDEDGFLEEWQNVVLKLDPRHWMANFFSMVATKDSPLFPFFAMAVAQAVYTEDLRQKSGKTRREEVEAHLLHLKDMTKEKLDHVKASYYRKKLHYVIEEPKKLYCAISRVYKAFNTLTCPKSKAPFFRTDSHIKFKQAMTYVKAGQLSDAPSDNLYVPVSICKVIFNCTDA